MERQHGNDDLGLDLRASSNRQSALAAQVRNSTNYPIWVMGYSERSRLLERAQSSSGAESCSLASIRSIWAPLGSRARLERSNGSTSHRSSSDSLDQFLLEIGIAAVTFRPVRPRFCPLPYKPQLGSCPCALTVMESESRSPVATSASVGPAIINA